MDLNCFELVPGHKMTAYCVCLGLYKAGLSVRRVPPSSSHWAAVKGAAVPAPREHPGAQSQVLYNLFGLTSLFTVGILWRGVCGCEERQRDSALPVILLQACMGSEPQPHGLHRLTQEGFSWN